MEKVPDRYEGFDYTHLPIPCDFNTLQGNNDLVIHGLQTKCKNLSEQIIFLLSVANTRKLYLLKFNREIKIIFNNILPKFKLVESNRRR